MSKSLQATTAHNAIVCYLGRLTIALNPATFVLGVVAIAMASTPAQCAEAAATTPRFVLEWGSQGSKPGQFDFPIGIAINRADEVFVTDFTNARVQKFSSNGKFLAGFAVSPFPGGIALDRDENIYVAHAGIPPSRFDEPRKRDMIAVFSPQGKPLREWGKFGTGDGEFDMPGGIAISRDGRVYVADQCNRRIQVFDTLSEPRVTSDSPVRKCIMAGVDDVCSVSSWSALKPKSTTFRRSS